MKYLIIIIATVLTSFVSLGIINRQQIRKCKGFLNKFTAAFRLEKKMAIYVVIMLFYMLVLATVMCIFNTEIISQLLKYISLASLMWPMAYIDYTQMRIPNKIVLLGLGYRAFVLVIELIFYRKTLLQTVVSELIALGATTIIIVICMLAMRGSIGMGDLKFLMMMSLMLGTNRFFSAILVIMLIAFVVALYLLIVKKKNKKDSFSFGPVIALGSLISLIIIAI